MTTVNSNLYSDRIRAKVRCANDFNDLRTYSLNACCGESHPSCQTRRKTLPVRAPNN